MNQIKKGTRLPLLHESPKFASFNLEFWIENHVNLSFLVLLRGMLRP
jgi:hypothetical protein